MVLPPIIKSTNNFIYSIWHLSHRYCYLLLSWKGWNRFECAVGGVRLYSNIYSTRCNVTQFILSGNCSTCFGWCYHPSSAAQTTVSTASGICNTVIAICRYRRRVGTGLSVLWVAYVYILIYIQQGATLHTLFYLETALHVSGGTIIHHQDHKQLYLQHLVFVTPLLLSAAIVEELDPV